MNRRQTLLSLSALAGHALFSHVLDRGAARRACAYAVEQLRTGAL